MKTIRFIEIERDFPTFSSNSWNSTKKLIGIANKHVTIYNWKCSLTFSKLSSLITSSHKVKIDSADRAKLPRIDEVA